MWLETWTLTPQPRPMHCTFLPFTAVNNEAWYLVSCVQKNTNNKTMIYTDLCAASHCTLALQQKSGHSVHVLTAVYTVVFKHMWSPHTVCSPANTHTHMHAHTFTHTHAHTHTHTHTCMYTHTHTHTHTHARTQTWAFLKDIHEGTGHELKWDGSCIDKGSFLMS